LQAQARHGLALHALHTNDLAKAERHARRGLEIARSREDVKLEAEMVRLVGEVSLGFDRYTDAQRHLEEALRLFRVAGDRQGEAEATGNLGKLAINSDRLDKAREYHGRALALAQEIGLRRLEVLSIRNLGSTAWGLCRYRSSLEHLERALPLAREIGDRRTESRICHGLFSALERLGRYGDAWPFIERGLALSRETGGGYLDGWSRMWRGVFLANHGLGKEALGELERAREIFEHHAGPRTQAWADGYLARARQILGDHDQALRDLERGLASCRRIGFLAGEARVLFRLGEAAEQADDRARAAACFDQVDALVQEATGVSWEHHSNAQSDYPAGAEPLLVSGLLAMAHRAALSGEHVDAARRAMEMCGGLPGHTQCMEAHFALFRATGERDHIATAPRMLCELRDRSPHEFRRSMIRDVPLHRAILTAWARFRRGW